MVGGTEFSNVRFHGDDARAAQVYAGATRSPPADVADTVFWVATLPERVNINLVEMMPVGQSFAGLSISARSLTRLSAVSIRRRR